MSGRRRYRLARVRHQCHVLGPSRLASVQEQQHLAGPEHPVRGQRQHRLADPEVLHRLLDARARRHHAIARETAHRPRVDFRFCKKHNTLSIVYINY